MTNLIIDSKSGVKKAQGGRREAMVRGVKHSPAAEDTSSDEYKRNRLTQYKLL